MKFHCNFPSDQRKITKWTFKNLSMIAENILVNLQNTASFNQIFEKKTNFKPKWLIMNTQKLQLNN